jgi:hypothetical protein
MEFTPSGPGSVAAFLVVVAAVIAAWLAAVYRAYLDDPRQARFTSLFALGFVAWLSALSALVASGALSALPLQGLPFFFGSIFAVSLGVALSPLGGRLAAGVPVAALVGFQAFRLPLELVLHEWAAQGTIPGSMTWTGQNWDILSGAVALVAAPFASRHRVLAWVANIVGGVLLLNVIRVAVLSSPVPFGWDVQPKLLLALHLPYMLIGPVCVGGALAGHVVLTRALMRR